MGDVATVQVGPAARRGAADLNGKSEAVAGIVIMRFGSDALKTIEAIKARIVEIERTLPGGGPARAGIRPLRSDSPRDQDISTAR